MGANHSYDKAIGGVPENARTHTDTGYRISGHKVVVQTSNVKQSANILNSNSRNPIYMIGNVSKSDSSIRIQKVNIFSGHHLSLEVNIKYDQHGHIKAFTGKEGGTHCHTWTVDKQGSMYRVDGHKKLSSKYNALLNQIVEFNNKHYKYHGKS